MFIIQEQVEEVGNNKVSDGVGMGVFLTSRKAVIADHSVPQEWPAGTIVTISFPYMPVSVCEV